jgi:7,8-dihydropterin-6-yl-methyl-4-(beta-D-ribofuranosyl)aminobenzene 5'-phosphate synthase
MNAHVNLQPVDAVDVTIVLDNALDILVPSTELAQRQPLAWDWSEREQLRAEHGYAQVVTVHRQGRSETILYDAGLGGGTVVHNLDVLGIDPSSFRTMVLSHGHADHHGGLEGLYQRLGRRRMPLILHPDAWLDRRVVFPTGAEMHLPPPSHNDLDREGWEIIEERGPSLLLDGALLVTGQVERVTDFEQGFPLQQRRAGDGWEPDTWIWDDQAVVVHVRGKGLVVLSSCSHAGAINILRHAQRLTGIAKIHAFVGGMHLTGGLFESILPRTVAELVDIAPDVVVPGHCSGWKAQHLVAASLPEAFLPSNVGTRLHFAATDEACELDP